MNPYPTIHIGGEERPVSFGMAAMALFSQMTNISLQDMFAIAQNMRLDHILTLAFCGLKDGARKAKAPFPHTPEEVADWFEFDTVGMEKIADIMNIYVAQTMKEEIGTDKKKQANPESQPGQ